MVTIRFVRIGRKGQPFFRIVAAEKSRAVQKKYLEKLGYYDPLFNEGEGKVVIDSERVLYYINNGSQISQTAARLLAKNGIAEVSKFVIARKKKEKKVVAKNDK